MATLVDVLTRLHCPAAEAWARRLSWRGIRHPADLRDLTDDHFQTLALAATFCPVARQVLAALRQVRDLQRRQLPLPSPAEGLSEGAKGVGKALSGFASALSDEGAGSEAGNQKLQEAVPELKKMASSFVELVQQLASKTSSAVADAETKSAIDEATSAAKELAPRSVTTSATRRMYLTSGFRASTIMPNSMG